MRRERKRPAPPSNLLHVTREDGEIVAVSREQVIPGPMEIWVNGELLGEATEVRVDNPVWQKEAE